MYKNLIILGIETSCDETSAAVVANGRHVMSNIISSSATYQEQFGGVVPEIASRKHIENISQVVDLALSDAGLTLKDIDAVASTMGPGLIGALLVGLNYGKSLAYSTSLPFIGVNHIDAHISSNFLESNLVPPFLCLTVSGGHTLIAYVTDYNKYTILGTTQDDAVGEAYDKVARLLNLKYPGGPKLDALANLGNATIPFPMAFINNGLNFSFSGIKSAVINYINTLNMKQEPIIKEDIAASFQKSCIDILVSKTSVALKQTGAKVVAVCGGVACNSLLRNEILKLAEKENILCHIPKPILCTDNGAMVASNAYFKYLNGETNGLNVNAYAR